MRLYEIAQEVRDVVAFLEDAHTPKETAEAPDPEVTHQLAWEQWEQMDQAFDIKVENAALARQETKRFVDILAGEIKRLQGLKATAQRTVESIDHLILDGFTLAKKRRVDGDRMRVWVQTGPQGVDVEDVNLIPKEFIRTVNVEFPGTFRESVEAFIRTLPWDWSVGGGGVPMDSIPDKDAIKRKLKSGSKVPGCQLRDGKPGVRVR